MISKWKNAPRFQLQTGGSENVEFFRRQKIVELIEVRCKRADVQVSQVERLRRPRRRRHRAPPRPPRPLQREPRRQDKTALVEGRRGGHLSARPPGRHDGLDFSGGPGSVAGVTTPPQTQLFYESDALRRRVTDVGGSQAELK